MDTQDFEALFADFFFSKLNHYFEACAIYREHRTAQERGDKLCEYMTSHARDTCNPGMAWRVFLLVKDNVNWVNIAQRVAADL